MAEPALKLLDRPEHAAAMLHPMRLRLLRALETPDSAAGLARKLDLPRQKVNYHLRTLESAGLVEEVEQRKKGNCMERVVRTVARTYLIGPQTLGSLAADPDRVPDKLSSSYQVAVAARAIRDLSILQQRADAAGQKLPTLTLMTEVRFASAAARNGFAEELTATVASLIEKYHDETAPNGRRFRLFLGSHPVITKNPPEDTHETDDQDTSND